MTRLFIWPYWGTCHGENPFQFGPSFNNHVRPETQWDKNCARIAWGNPRRSELMCSGPSRMHGRFIRFPLMSTIGEIPFLCQRSRWIRACNKHVHRTVTRFRTGTTFACGGHCKCHGNKGIGIAQNLVPVT